MREDEFDQIPLEEAQERWVSELEFRSIIPLHSYEEMAIDKSLGRVTAAPVNAKISAPFYYSAACDGIAVKSSDSLTAGNGHRLKLKIGHDAYFVDTGGVIPEGFDAVLSIQEVQLQSLEEIILENPVTPWKNVRPIGEDVSAHEVIIGENRVITPLDIGALCAGGLRKVAVRKKPRTGILPVGTHLISPGSPPQIGKSIDFKSTLLAQLVESCYGESCILGVVPERIEDIRGFLKKGLDRLDILCIISGPSWGTKTIKKLLTEMGELLVGSLNINPGSTLCLGIIDGKPVIALSDYPVSIYLGFELFCRPLIHKMLGMDNPGPHKIDAQNGRTLKSKKGVREFRRVNIGEVGEKIISLSISRGAEVLMSLVKADGIMVIPEETTIIEPGEKVQIELMPCVKNTKKNILMTGTYDIFIDVLKNHMEKKLPGIALHSANVGSIEGLKALKAGLAHISGIHAFDKRTGKYNVTFVKKILPQTPLSLVNLFHRKIGLIVRRGNPKGIKNLSDLVRHDIIFVNRQKNSGTRAILEYNLAQDKLDIAKISTYPKEAKTHISLASVIASGLADTGFGILPAAKAFKLDFIPLFPETFDLVIPERFINSFVTQVILEIINSSEFRAEIGSMGGYDLTYTGKVTYRQR